MARRDFSNPEILAKAKEFILQELKGIFTPAIGKTHTQITDVVYHKKDERDKLISPTYYDTALHDGVKDGEIKKEYYKEKWVYYLPSEPKDDQPDSG